MPRTRAHGGGRRPHGEFHGNTKILTVRVRPELRASLERLAKRHRRSLSQEIQRGLDEWIGRSTKSKPHIGALMHAIALLVGEIERITGENWHEDAFTGKAVRQAVERLIFHFAPTPESAMPVPPRMMEVGTRQTAAYLGTTQAALIITVIENAAAMLPDEWGFWKIFRDLGSGSKRNRAV